MRCLRCGAMVVLLFGVGLGMMLALLFSSNLLVGLTGTLLMFIGIVLNCRK